MRLIRLALIVVALIALGSLPGGAMGCHCPDMTMSRPAVDAPAHPHHPVETSHCGLTTGCCQVAALPDRTAWLAPVVADLVPPIAPPAARQGDEAARGRLLRPPRTA